MANLINAKTQQPIPKDEPVFLLRAKDKNAALAIAYYKKLCENQEHAAAVNKRLHEFVNYAHNKPEIMKTPDT